MKPTYQSDLVTLYLARCEDVLPTLQPASVDLLLTDPPYGVSQAGVVHVRKPGNGSRNIDFFPDDTPEFSIGLCMAAAELADRLLKPSASAYWWCGHRQFGPLTDWYSARKWKTRFLVWAKACPCPPPPGSGWPSAAEICLYAWRLNRVWTHGGTDYPLSNVIVADSYRHGQPGKVDHPTQKPFGVVAPLITASTWHGYTVLDPFMGSGTTGVAAVQLGRRFVGIECDENYYKIAERRIRQAEQDARLFEPPVVEAEPVGLFDAQA
jgi:DNA modification methylase